MKKNIFYLCFAAILLASCSSAYRSSQTPDDVYYSPGQRMYSGAEEDQYLSYDNPSDDNYLRMKAADHYRWDNLDDFDYWNDSRYYYSNYYNPWSTYFSLGFYNVYNPYTSFWYNPWNSWYYPSYTVVYYKNPVAYYGTRTANSYHLSTYGNRTYNNYNMPLQSGNRSNAYNNSNIILRRNNNNFNINQNRNFNSNPNRTFNNNSGGNFNAGSRNNISSGGGGGMSRPSHH